MSVVSELNKMNNSRRSIEFYLPFLLLNIVSGIRTKADFLDLAQFALK